MKGREQSLSLHSFVGGKSILLIFSMFNWQSYRFRIARLLVGLYVLVLINGVVFRHAHRLADGTMICHAHPFKGTPGTQFPNHAHTDDQLIWLDVVDDSFFIVEDSVSWTPVLFIIWLLTTTGFVGVTRPSVSVHSAFRHRGPPMSCA